MNHMPDLIIKTIVPLLVCTSGMLIIFYFMEKMYQPRFHQKYVKILSYFVFSALWFYVNSLKVPIFNFTYFVLSTILIGVFLYKAKRIVELLQIFVFIFCYAGLDDLLSALLSLFSNAAVTPDENALLLLIKVIAIQTFMFVFSKILIAFLKKQKLSMIYKGHFLFLSLIIILNIITIYIITILATFQSNPTMTYLTLLLMAIISGFLNLAIFYIIDNMSKSYKLENDLTLMKQQMDMQYKYYQQLEMEYDNSQKIMHDIKKHIQVMERLNQNGLTEEGLEYTKRISQIVEQLGFKFKCNNKILNIIINENIKLCDLNQIEFIYSIENINFDFMDDVDITIIFANLLDNSVEACRRIAKGSKFIEIRIYYYNDMVIINLINSIGRIPESSQGEFVSSKKGHKAIGLSNVKETVKKYDGDIDISVEQDKFLVSIMFPRKS